MNDALVLEDDMLYHYYKTEKAVQSPWTSHKSPYSTNTPHSVTYFIVPKRITGK
jgi:hypothetical protein